MTRFEQIARAFPLHAQRIAEATSNKEYLTQPAAPTPSQALLGAFVFVRTVEGQEYWWSLVYGGAS